MNIVAGILAFLVLIAVVAICYFLGNYILKSFDKSIAERLQSTGIGFLALALLAAGIGLCAVIFMVAYEQIIKLLF